MNGDQEKGFSERRSWVGSQRGFGARASTTTEPRNTAAAKTRGAASQGEDYESVQGALRLSQRGCHCAGRPVGCRAEKAELRQGRPALSGSLLAARLERKT